MFVCTYIYIYIYGRPQAVEGALAELVEDLHEVVGEDRQWPVGVFSITLVLLIILIV